MIKNFYHGNNFEAIKQKIDNDYNNSISIWQTYWNQASIDSRLECGDVYLGSYSAGYTGAPNTAAARYVFNRVRPMGANLSGIQRLNRKSTIVVPEDNGDQVTADQWSRILLNIFKRENVYGTISTAFHQGAFITGLNLLHVYMDYRNDPVNGEVKVDNVPYAAFIIDPYFTKPDLSDAQFIRRRSYMSHAEAASLLPAEDYDKVMAINTAAGWGPDQKFQFMPEVQGQTWTNKVAYDEYYYRDSREQKLLVDKETGEILDVTSQDNLDIDFFLESSPRVELIKQRIPTVRVAILINDKVFYDGPSGMDRYPFAPVFGYFNPSLSYFYNRIQGVCRSLRDPQALFNRRVVLSLDMIEAQLTGFKFKEDSVIDTTTLFQTGAGRIIPIKKDAQMSDVEQIVPPQIPPSFFQMQETLSQEFNMVTGMSMENLGQVVDDAASGIKTALRQGAGLTAQQILFDNLDKSQILLSEIMMEYVRSNWTPGKIKIILGGEEPAPLFYNKAFGRYRATVELGFDTQTQKQTQFAQLLQLKSLGVEIPAKTLIQAASVQNKDELLRDIEEQQQQVQQAQQQQNELQMENLRAQAELTKARAQADAGLGVERMSRVAENQQLAKERQSQAIKDDYQALLNYAKALKELETIDLDQIRKLMDMKRLLDVQKEEPASQDNSINPNTLGE